VVRHHQAEARLDALRAPPEGLTLREVLQDAPPHGCLTELQAEGAAVQAPALPGVARGQITVAEHQHAEVAAREQGSGRQAAERAPDHHHVEVASHHG
jgi:hypothetical protein